ncbi:MAG: DUF47 family protein [Desulfurococcaceae archaeon]|uniref:DUF47 family protein n=1 Tax=Staphylothermus marinus TaxID=2280 RepID=A0A7C4D8B2_STAMA
MLREILPEDLIKLLERYADYLNRIIENFSKGMRLINEIRIGEARGVFAKVIELQIEADNIRKQIVSILEEIRIDAAFKEDLFHLVKRIERTLDWIKEASRELTIIPYLEIPNNIRNGIEELINTIVKSAGKVVEAIKSTLNGEYDRVKILVEEIESLEEKADEIDLSNRSKLIKYHDQIKPCTLAILIHDLNRDLEEAADSCREVADYLRAIIVGWIRR